MKKIILKVNEDELDSIIECLLYATDIELVSDKNREKYRKLFHKLLEVSENV